MKELWIMCADSESGDHYHACMVWDHEPSKDEVNRVKIKLDCTEIGEEDKDDADFFVDGVPYINYVYERIRKITI